MALDTNKQIMVIIGIACLITSIIAYIFFIKNILVIAAANILAIVMLRTGISSSTDKMKPIIEPFLNNIRRHIISQEKQITGYKVKTDDLEFLLNYPDMKSIKEISTPNVIEYRAAFSIMTTTANKLNKFTSNFFDNAYGQDTIIFNFCIDKDKVINPERFRKVTMANFDPATDRIKTQLKLDDNNMIKGGFISENGDTIEVSISIDRQSAIDHSEDAYNTLLAVKKMLTTTTDNPDNQAYTQQQDTGQYY